MSAPPRSSRKRPEERQLDCEFGAFAHKAFNTDSAVVLLDNLPAHAQTQAAAAVTLFVGFFRREEWLKDETQSLGRDADARVGDGDLGHFRRRVLAHLDLERAAA